MHHVIMDFVHAERQLLQWNDSFWKGGEGSSKILSTICVRRETVREDETYVSCVSSHVEKILNIKSALFGQIKGSTSTVQIS